MDSVSVKEGDNQTVALRVVSEGVFARPISIGVACSPERASNVSAGNVLTCVCMNLIYTYLHTCIHAYCTILCMHLHTCGILYVLLTLSIYVCV